MRVTACLLPAGLRRHLVFLPLLLGAAAPGCTGDAPAAAQPAGEPYIRGTITAVEEHRIRVEEAPGMEAGGAKAVLRLGEGTRILHGDGTSAGPAELAAGTVVRAWVTGPVMKSYPVQATASAVVIGTPPPR